MRDKLLKLSYVVALIAEIVFVLGISENLFFLIPAIICLLYIVAFGEANNGNWIISLH